MSEVSYFQRYSQPENLVTNNTLLVLRHVYNHSPFKLQKLLDELIGEDKIKVGVFFNQQTKSENSNSIPDGAIKQNSFNIIIETKTYSKLNKPQLIKHLEGLQKDNSFLIGLTTEEQKATDFDMEEIQIDFPNFVNVTYSQLVEALDKNTALYETELRQIVEDYIDYIKAQGLINQKHNQLFAIACGKTIDENLGYNLYYEPLERRNKFLNCKFIGLYYNKRVNYIGEIIATIGKEAGVDSLHIEHSTEGNNNQYLLLVKNLIETKKHEYFNKPQRFYIVKDFHKTEYIKQSKNPIRSIKYFDLEKYGIMIPKDAEQLAHILKGKTFD